MITDFIILTCMQIYCFYYFIILVCIYSFNLRMYTGSTGSNNGCTQEVVEGAMNVHRKQQQEQEMYTSTYWQEQGMYAGIGDVHSRKYWQEQRMYTGTYWQEQVMYSGRTGKNKVCTQKVLARTKDVHRKYWQDQGMYTGRTSKNNGCTQEVLAGPRDVHRKYQQEQWMYTGRTSKKKGFTQEVLARTILVRTRVVHGPYQQEI